MDRQVDYKGIIQMERIVNKLIWFIPIISCQVLIFCFDVFTREDDVSIGFVYVLPTLMGFFVRDRALQLTIIATSMVLILIGCFVPIPINEDLPTFLANRFLSIVTVLITGIMIRLRVRLEMTLFDALERERKSSATQRAFVSMVSHEFRTPLTIIDAEAYRLDKLKNTIAPEDIERRAKSIRESVGRMVKLIEDVLYSSRAQENLIELYVEEINLASIIRSVCSESKRHSYREILCDLEAMPEMIIGDSSLLTNVFENLIGNAVKYSSKETKILVSGTIEGNNIIVTVEDQGIGIPADDLPKLFQPYFRATNVAIFPGSGVGLYFVQTVVRLHGGKVSAKSEIGKGSCFTVHLIHAREAWPFRAGRESAFGVAERP